MAGIPAGLPAQAFEHHGIDRLGGKVGDVGHGREATGQPLDHIVDGAEQAADRIGLVLERVERRQGGVQRAVVPVQPLFQAFEAPIQFFGARRRLAHRVNQQRQGDFQATGGHDFVAVVAGQGGGQAVGVVDMLGLGRRQPGVMVVAGVQGLVAQGGHPASQRVAFSEEAPVFVQIEALRQARAVGGVVLVGEGLEM